MGADRQRSLFPSQQRNIRLYSLFEQVESFYGKKVWRRCSNFAYPKQQAVKVFQNQLLAHALGLSSTVRCLKPVKEAHRP